MDVRRWFPTFQEKSADSREAQADIEAYIRETIALRQAQQLSTQERLILQDPSLAQEIIEALMNGADGMYVLLFEGRMGLLSLVGFSGLTTKLRKYANALATMRSENCLAPSLRI